MALNVAAGLALLALIIFLAFGYAAGRKDPTSDTDDDVPRTEQGGESHGLQDQGGRG